MELAVAKTELLRFEEEWVVQQSKCIEDIEAELQSLVSFMTWWSKRNAHPLR